MPEDFMTKLIHTGEEPEDVKFTPKVPPIFLSSVFSFDTVEQLDDVYESAKGYIYSRMGNPTTDNLRKILAAIDDGEDALVYSSGMAAIAMAILANIKSGDHIIADSVLYGGTRELLSGKLKKFNVDVTFVDFQKEGLKEHVRPNTKIFYMETISNPLMQVSDIKSVAETAHRCGAKLIVDNTFATPVVCQPLKLGADIVVYSMTKYMGGHSDVMGGAVVSDKENIEAISHEGVIYGPTMSPFDGWLFSRSLRTLELRMRRHCENAYKLARYLDQHEKVKRVYYPGLSSSKSYKTAAQIFNNGLFGGMMSIDLEGGKTGACQLINALDKVKLVPSLAGVTTTVSYPAKTSHRSMNKEEREGIGITDGLIRISVGLEDAEDIIEEFDKALKNLTFK